MNYFIDTEYDWKPSKGVLCPVSIALVADDGREYYAYCANFRQLETSPFVESHVMPVLQSIGPQVDHKTLDRVRDDIVRFIGDDVPAFWGDYAAFDYVMLSMIMGEFGDWPGHWPMHINDMQQDAIPSIQAAVPHNALSDARAIRDAWNHAFQRDQPA